jgi:hypothetical protein
VHVRILSLIAVLVAAVVVVGGSGAGTAKVRKATKIDVSTRSAVIHYLRSIHVNPRGAVIQRGARNYAGPRCPGKAWTCTSTAHRVIQVASAGGKNVFRCSTARCSVVQASVQAAEAPLAINTAKCIRTTGITQSCSISQTSTGAGNEAIIVEIATKTSGLTQNASQTAQIVQSAGSGANTACVLQRTRIEGSTVAKTGVPVNVNLDAHQTLSVVQDSLSGGNTLKGSSDSGGCISAHAEQSQAIVSNARGSAAINQNLNRIGSVPNMIANIEQNQNSGFANSGQNTALLNQTNILGTVANGPGPSVQQKLGTANGGLEATVNQFSHNDPPSPLLVNTSDVNQMEIQCVHAQVSVGASYPLPQPPFPPATKPTCPSGGTQPASLVQEQHGPMRKGPCCSVQGDNPGDTFTVGQDSFQDSDGHATQTNLVQGECTTAGNCTVIQTTNVDGTSHTNTQSGQDVDTQTTCSGDTCTSTGPTTTGDLTLLPDGLSVANTDVAEFGDGGMRGSGTGSITVSGVSGLVFHAFLYWNGPTNSADPDVNADVTFDGSPITGTNIGISGDNNWGFQNSQSYRADVTSLVTGDGAYSLADFLKPDADINGVALIVFYDNANSGDDRNVVLWNGNDSNCLAGGIPENWDETINDVPYNGGTASLDFIVGDGQSFSDGAVSINGLPFIPAGQNFDGDSVPPNVVNGLWDVKSFTGLESFLTNGSTTDLHLTSPADGDCLSLVVAAANVPVSGPVILAPTARPTTAARAPANAPSAAAGSGGATR